MNNKLLYSESKKANIRNQLNRGTLYSISTDHFRKYALLYL